MAAGDAWSIWSALLLVPHTMRRFDVPSQAAADLHMLRGHEDGLPARTDIVPGARAAVQVRAPSLFRSGNCAITARRLPRTRERSSMHAILPGSRPPFQKSASRSQPDSRAEIGGGLSALPSAAHLAACAGCAPVSKDPGTSVRSECVNCGGYQR